MTAARDEFADLRHVMALCGELSGLAATDCDLEQVVTLVAGRVGVWAAVVDDTLSVLAAGGAGPAGAGGGDSGPGPAGAGGAGLAGVLDNDPDAVAQLVAAASRMRRALSLPAAGASAVSLVVAPILVGDDAVAHLVTAGHDADETGEDARIMVTEHAAMVCAVVLGRRRVVAIAAGRARRELFDGLVLVGDRTGSADAEGWARHLGIEPGQRHRVLVAAVRPPAGAPAAPLPAAAAPTAATAAIDLVEHMLATRCPGATVVNRDTEVVALVPGDDDAGLARRLTALAALCRDAVAARFPGVRLVAGLGDPHTGAGRISTSYTEARRAVDIGSVMPGLSGVTVFAELGVHRLLAQVRDPGELGGFARDVLGDLIDHDRDNGTDYCATLTAYFRQNGSLRRAADLLHTHPNTVVYRIHRAEKISRLDLGSYPDRLAAQVALEIVNALGGDV
ncbi:PucR family transcriptional regulator [Actinacidiphila sp. bgisy145]|uniref:PucR family transcriptional regulator n=1 Tax=Actinacidiphila sp. bgisy145 TaxID=3413792 RepID=UPI003EC05FF0